MIQLNKLWLFLLITFMSSLLGCISSENGQKKVNVREKSFDLEYPSSWSKRAFKSDCSNIAGKFHSSGEVIGNSHAPLRLNGKNSLERVLSRGAFGGDVDSADLIFMVDTSVLNITYHGSRLQSVEEYGKVPPEYRNELRRKINGTCSDGQLVIHSKRPWGGNGESATTKSEITSYLSITDDGDLVVRSFYQLWISSWFGLSIDKLEMMGWYKYKSF